MADLPLQFRQDSRYFTEKHEDITIRGDLEGGFAYTRRRTTRDPRRVLTTGYTEISDVDKQTIEAFFLEHGTFAEFNYLHPIQNNTIIVRLKSNSVNYQYVGSGGNHLWTITGIELIEV